MTKINTGRSARRARPALRGCHADRPFHPFVPSVIRAFRAAFPLVSLTLDQCLRTAALERLRHERMDVAFLRPPLSEPQELVVYALLEEPMVVALPDEHRPARKSGGGNGALSLRDLAGEAFIVYARASTGPRSTRRRWRHASGQASALASAGKPARYVGPEPGRRRARHFSRAGLHAANGYGRRRLSPPQGHRTTDARPELGVAPRRSVLGRSSLPYAPQTSCKRAARRLIGSLAATSAPVQGRA